MNRRALVWVALLLACGAALTGVAVFERLVVIALSTNSFGLFSSLLLVGAWSLLPGLALLIGGLVWAVRLGRVKDSGLVEKPTEVEQRLPEW